MMLQPRMIFSVFLAVWLVFLSTPACVVSAFATTRVPSKTVSGRIPHYQDNRRVVVGDSPLDPSRHSHSTFSPSTTRLEAMDVSHLFLAEASTTDNLMSKLAMTAGGSASGSVASTGPAAAAAAAAAATMMESSSDPSVLLVGGGVVAALLALAALVASKSGGDGGDSASSKTKADEIEPEPEPIDVSIPYDAAILLAYQQVIGGSKLDNDPEKVMKSPIYQTFKKLYLEQSVLEITLKQKNKQMDSFVESLVSNN